MSERLHFKYQSIGNIVRLLITIQFEKTRPDRDIFVYHRRLDKEKDNFFENCLLELYPNGVTIGENEINQLIQWTDNFLLKDKEAKHLYTEWDKQHLTSYVYFKIDDKVYPAYYLSHFGIVKDICCDYFKGFEKIDIDYLQRFILENFEIASDFTSPASVANDARYIANCICLGSDTE